MDENVKELSVFFEIYGGKEEAIKKCIKATNELRNIVEEDRKNEVALSKDAQKIKELCVSFGPLGDMISQVVSIMIKEDVTHKTNNRKFPYIPISCIVPVNKGGDIPHNYAVGSPIFMFINDDHNGDNRYPKKMRCLKADGVTIGSDVCPSSAGFKVADDDMIVKIIDTIFLKLGNNHA